MSSVLNIQDVPTKTCKGCGKNKPLVEFHRTPNNKDGFLNKCKDCKKPDEARKKYSSEYNKKYWKTLKADPERHAKRLAEKKEFSRTEKYYENYYKKRFGVSYKDLFSMLAKQHGLCANIGCSKSIVLPPSDGDRACVDHSHFTGKVRSLLCVRCNTVLGHIENDMQLMPGLMDYLNKHG